MKKEVAKAWVKDLRKCHNQAKGVLANGKGYCCLGRLCLVLGAKFKKDKNTTSWVNKYHPVLKGINLSETLVLPREIQKMAGMKTSTGQFKNDELSAMNDDGKTFAEIADVIEQNWKDL